MNFRVFNRLVQITIVTQQHKQPKRGTGISATPILCEVTLLWNGMTESGGFKENHEMVIAS